MPPGVHEVEPDPGARIRGAVGPPSADEKLDVPGAEERKVALLGRPVADPYQAPAPEHAVGSPRQVDPLGSVGGEHQAGAVKPVRASTTPDVGLSLLAPCPVKDV